METMASAEMSDVWATPTPASSLKDAPARRHAMRPRRSVFATTAPFLTMKHE